jgi:hypothetical protein
VQVMAIVDGYGGEDVHSGPFTDPALARIVLDIIHKTIDSDASLETYQCDPYARQLKAGMKPYSIGVELDSLGKVVETKVEMIWPPKDEEGIYDDRDFWKSYFVWAKSPNDAKLRLSVAERQRRGDN